MKFIKHLFNYFGINCFLTKHEWVKHETYEGCSKCPAIKVKQGGKDIIL